ARRAAHSQGKRARGDPSCRGARAGVRAIAGAVCGAGAGRPSRRRRKEASATHGGRAMKPIERGEVLGLADYEAVRDRFRARVIDEKKRRRVKLGDRASCVFENRDTVLMQIQEMLRTERITRDAGVLHEIETYNELVPGPHEVSATILIEIEDKEPR